MEFNTYFQSYKNYFWQWEEDATILTIPKESTIAYSEFIRDVFEHLSPQGLPPLGSLLLAVIATNTNGIQSLHYIKKLLQESHKAPEDGHLLTEVLFFLELLTTIPTEYKTGKKRILLFQAIFEGCHNGISAKTSKLIYNAYLSNKHKQSGLLVPAEFSLSAFYRDFRTISLLKQKFENVDAIIDKIIALPEIPKALTLIDSGKQEDRVEKDFIDELMKDSKTIHVGSLVKRIWSGLNIPANTALPSQQPLGGVSDLTNKGDFDKLLISEFANDDLIFLSRLANNEALYIQREVPPAADKLHRVLLIDVSLKNWGTPKTIAFAAMLAIARHPKTTTECSVYAIGNTYYPVSIDSKNALIEGLQLLEGSIHAANGLTAFFKEYPSDKNREVFFITEASTLKQTAMLKAATEYHASIHYWIHTDAEGSIDVYKKQQSSKRHIQHIQLPLEELWRKKVQQIPGEQSARKAITKYPILFRKYSNSKKILSTSDGEIFHLTKDKALFRLYEKSAKKYEKGWDLVLADLPFVADEFEMGLLKNGEYVLLLFKSQNRELIVWNCTTGVKKSILFNEWKSALSSIFVYHDQCFYYLSSAGNWAINLDGVIKLNTTLSWKMAEHRRLDIKLLSEQHTNTQAVFKNIHTIFINEADELVFNVHSLLLNTGGHVKLEQTTKLNMIIEADKVSDTEFVFKDGSSIHINRNGMFILMSSNHEIPGIFIPSVLDASLGLATEEHFAGNEYYYKDSVENHIQKISTSVFIQKYIKGFIHTIQANGIRN